MKANSINKIETGKLEKSINDDYENQHYFEALSRALNFLQMIF